MGFLGANGLPWLLWLTVTARGLGGETWSDIKAKKMTAEISYSNYLKVTNDLRLSNQR